MATNAKSNAKSKKFVNFLKKNVALIVIIACVLAISGIIIGESIANSKPQTRYPVIEGNGIVEEPIDPGPGPGPGPVVTEPEWVAPVSSYTLGMSYSLEEYEFSKTLGHWFIHKGLDLITADGANVFAACDGVIESITSEVLEGTTITINHGNGLKTAYSSLAENVLVTVGQTVKSGDIIGFASESAYNEFMDGAHVHFEMTQNGTHIDPRTYIEIV